MGISEGSAAVDCSVGTIVWVRRRNGSWWPGRILGPHELAASHIMSPRSGTPVKLLGREDASVDWYNLEKSKRVKAFRCGEFDDCIEKAESCQGMPIKKREKYARREDAILHALELEKQLLEKKQQKLGVAPSYMSNKMPGALKKEYSTFSPSENHEGNDGTRDHCKFMNVKTQLPPKRSDLFLDEENMHDPLYIQKGKLTKDLNWEDENSESIPRMRGLQDFGLRTAPSKRKLSASVAYESLRKPFSVDNHAHPSSGEHNIRDANHVTSIKNSLGIKRKRSLGGVNEESLVKRRDRRRPLVQVLKSSAKLPASHLVQSDGDALSISALGGKDQGNAIFRGKRSRCIYLPADSNACLDHTEFSSDQMQISPSHLGADKYLLHPGSLTEENISPGLIEAQESDSSETDSLGLDLDEEGAVLSDSHLRNSGRHVDRSGSVLRVPGQPGNVNNEELDECALSSDMCELHPHEQTSDIAADIGGSKWQLKGKRNIRNLAKRPMEAMDGRDPIIAAEKCNGSIHGSFFETRGSVPKLGRMVSQRALEQVVHHGSDELNHAYYEGGLIDNDFGQREMAGYGNRRYPLSLKASSRDRGRSNNNFTSSDEDSHLMSPTVQRAASLSQAVLRGYWEEPHECFDPMYAGHLINGVETMLIDVDLKVQASYQGERVPLVSLMSRLNGKAIIGHPVQIEPMEDGSSDFLLSTNEFGECLPETDGNTGLPPVWRTARRTAMHRVPRSHQPVALDGEEADPTYYSDLEREPLFKKPNASCSDHKVSLAKKNLSHIQRPGVDKKFPKKLLKKMSSSSQKTRTLSSIATEQNPSAKKSGPKQSDKTGDFDSSIKPEMTVPSVTCIPVKLVFSRILEAVGRPPSKAATSFAEWKPS